MKRVQIYKNAFLKYWQIADWDDVPEFLLFETLPEEWVKVLSEPEKPVKGQLKRAKMEGK